MSDRYVRPLLLFLISSTLACAPAKRHKILDFFFDGVPPLTQDKPDTTQETTSTKETRQRVALPTVYEHPPHEEGLCEVCHSVPEDGTFSGKTDLLLPANLLCFECHDEFQAKTLRTDNAWVHGPVAAGECIACHGPHKTSFPHLLRSASREEICGRCHEREILSPIAAHGYDVEKICLDCHFPHYGPAKAALVSADPSDQKSLKETPP